MEAGTPENSMSNILTTDGISRFKYAIQIPPNGTGPIRDFTGVASQVAKRVYEDLSVALGFIAWEMKGGARAIAADYRRMLIEKFGFSESYLDKNQLFPGKERVEIGDLAAAIRDLAALMKQQANLTPGQINSKMKDFWGWMQEPLRKSPGWGVYEVLCDAVKDDRLVMTSAWREGEPVLISQRVGPKKATKLRLRWGFNSVNGSPGIYVEPSADHWYFLRTRSGVNSSFQHRLAAFDGRSVVGSGGDVLVDKDGQEDHASYYTLVRHPSEKGLYVLLHASCKLLAVNLWTFSVLHTRADSDTDLSDNDQATFGVWWSIEQEGGWLKIPGL